MNNREAFEAQRVLINLFERWKGYELPDLNSDNQFDKEWLHREWVAFQAGYQAALASQQDHIGDSNKLVNKVVFDSESARQFLIESVLPKFSDSTFQKYVLEELAGDFAYQLAIYLQSQAQHESQIIRKAFICPACECVYADSPVSHCDCFENHSNTYIEGSIIYTPAPEGGDNGTR